MKRLALNLLAWLAKLVAEKYQVKIVAITGSVGKTTVKEAIFAVLKQAYDVQRSLYNANTEWGIAASVIAPGFEPVFTADGKAKIGLGQYCQLVWQAKMKLLFRQKYPQVLVLELAADRPNDIRWFNKWFKYDIAVITLIGSTHLEFYKDQAELTAEKLALADAVKQQGLVVINGECDQCQTFVAKPNQRRTTFGWNEHNDYWAELVSENRYRLHHHEQVMEVGLPVGRQFVPAALMAWAVGQEFALNSEQIQSGLSQLQPVAGRFQIEKTDQWTIIDDTYNAAPESTQMALMSLQDIAATDGQSSAEPRRRRVAILGEMRELGDKKISQHHQIGELVATKVDLLIAMGEGGALIADGAGAAGMDANKILKINWRGGPEEVEPAIRQILPILLDGDTVLVKASRTIYLDRLVRELVKHRC
ncbi:MAG: UDP-N-acetylmuramoyl-tripeptide--D-alanyl-D-alanine ligase [Patescibacteria group bacterium]|jgi:UDP-N-acetylmuramoyl-tripeptide--D-alanyl-D-alanine ligase